MFKQFQFFVQILIVFSAEVLEIFLKLFSPQKPKSVRGRLALISGGGRGLGKALSIRLAQEGCNIAICDLNLNEAEEACNEIREKFNIKAEAFKCDVSKTEQVKELRDNIKTKFDCDVELLVNNAGILAPLATLEGEDKDIQKVLDINLASHFWMIRAFLPKMIEQKYGHILGICSAAGKVSSPFASPYCASKFGVNGLYQALYDDLCVFDHDEFIKLTVAFPGFIDTRNDLVELLSKMRSIIPRVTTEEAAEIIINTMLLDKREIVFPLFYRLGIIMDLIMTPKTSKFVKSSVAKVNKNLQERIEMSRI